MKQYAVRLWASLLALSLLLSLAACGEGRNTTASTMRLRRTEGTVSVSDGGGKDVPVLNDLGLYSGYGVGTRMASYAWIDLDDVKLVKLDQNSEISIQKEGKQLDIEVQSGSLFFNVTQPLEDDEAMSIHSSTMLVGIRGTCGWVEARGVSSRVYLLEGKVECSAGEQTVQVSAGEFAELTADGELTVQEFDRGDLPAFVRDEVDEAPGPGNSEDPQASNTPEPTFTPEPTPTPAPTPEADNITWSLVDGTLTISGTGRMPDYPYMGTPWYGSREEIHTVVISDGVTSIGNRAFGGCKGLTGVSIPDSVTSIGDYAFDHCTSLPGVTIPNSVTSIGNDAFFGCSSLTGVIIPDSVTTIGNAVFSCCYSLTSVTIPASVTSIGSSVFSVCYSLTDIYYGGSESQWGQIGAYVFTNATIHYNSTGN